jgi:hypothetical protein
MTYKCNECKYETTRKDAYDKHITANIHDLNTPKFCCKYCPTKYTRQTNLSKHIQICPCRDSYENNLENEIKLLKDANDQLKNANNISISAINELKIELHDYRQKYQFELKSQIKASAKLLNNAEYRIDKSDQRTDKLIENSGTLVNNSLNTISKTIGALGFINKNFSDAPPAQPLISYDMFKKPKDGQLVEELVYYYNQKMLAGYIGDIYIKEYAKANPKDQSLWNTDTNRLTYYIRVILDKTKPVNNSESEWITDKKGLLVSEYTLKPILDFLSKEINKYIQDKSKYMIKYPKKPNGKIISNLTYCGEISILIDNGKLETDILKYIAPKFDLSRAKKSKLLLKHNKCKIEEINEDDKSDKYQEEEKISEKEINIDSEDEQVSDCMSDYEFDEDNNKVIIDENFGFHHNLIEPEEKY